MIMLLDALLDRAPHWCHGYELMKGTGLLSGTLYPLLMRMTEQQLVQAEWREPAQPGRPARHVYRLTETGLEFARASTDREVRPSSSAMFA